MALDFKNVTKVVSSTLGEIIKIKDSLGNVLWQLAKTLQWFGYPIICDGSLAKSFDEVKLYGNSVQSNLPDGYTQLSYIESAGTQYIDTGIVSSDIRIVEMTGSFGDDTGWHLDGVADIANVSFHIGGNGSKVAYRIGTGSDTTTSIDCSQNILSYKLDNINGTFTVGSDSISFTPLDQPTVSTYTYTLFAARRTLNIGYYQTNAKKYSYKLYDKDSALLFNGIPAKRNSDSAIGMYDLVTNTFFTNAGTGTFTAGSEATPSPSNPIEIQSVGDKTVNLLNTALATSEQTINGVTFTPMGDGTFKINGTATSTARYKISEQSFSAGTYQVCRYNSSIAGGTFAIELYNSTISKQVYVNSDTITFDSDIDKITVNIFILGGKTVDNIIVKPLITSESELPSSYEPYGKYKLPITCSGKNLVNKVLTVGLNRNRTYIVDTSTEIISPYTTAGSWQGIGYYAKVKPNTTYTVSGDITGADADSPFIGFYENEDDVASYLKEVSHISKSSIFTTPSNVNYVVIAYITSTAGGTITFDKLQLEQGSTATSYTPYVAPVTQTIYLSEPLRKVGTYSDVIDCIPESKNLLNPTLATTTQSGITCTNNGDGTYNISGTATANVYFTFASFDFVANTSYRISGLSSSQTLEGSYLYVNGDTYPTDSGSGVTYTPTSSQNIRLTLFVPSGKTVNFVCKPMISTDLSSGYYSYVPYGPCYEITRNIGSVDLSSLTYAVSGDNHWKTGGIVSHFTSNADTFIALAECYKADSANNVYSGINLNAIANEDGTNITVYNGSTTDTPTGECVYALATPTTESYSLTDTIDGFSGYTRIETSTEISPTDGYAKQEQ